MSDTLDVVSVLYECQVAREMEVFTACSCCFEFTSSLYTPDRFDVELVLNWFNVFLVFIGSAWVGILLNYARSW